MNYFNFQRRKSSVVNIGNTPLGGEFPIRIQSMTTTSTMNTEGSIEQCEKIIAAGADYVRLTTQGEREADNLVNIKQGLSKKYTTPLVADTHFNPKAADRAALYVEKVRINPGNYVDPARTFKSVVYTDDEYSLEIKKIEERLVSFLDICKKNNTAIRIGVNHGSLSDRIMTRYGDTPAGMVESCLEFLRICVAHNFLDVVISIKASNPGVMIRTVRLMVDSMSKENMNFPIHLGVTEAGDSEDGRIKSAVGIGSLLSDGIGDTIRVSLSEDPELEIPVATKLVNYIKERTAHEPIIATASTLFNYYDPQRRKTHAVGNIGGENSPVVIAFGKLGSPESHKSAKPDYLYVNGNNVAECNESIPSIINYELWKQTKNTFPVFNISELNELKTADSPIKFLRVEYRDANDALMELIKKDKSIVLVLYTNHQNPTGEQRAFFHWLLNNNCTTPVIIEESYNESDLENLQVKAGTDFGTLLIDGFGEGICLRNEKQIDQSIINNYMFVILQAVRLRISKTDYTSCPGCGRTLFDLQSTIAKIKEATSHMVGLKIGIMGCIVNGPGEMADADYGYVGAARGKVSLYKKKECIEKNIPEDQAVEKLIELIKINGDWKEKTDK